MTVRAHAPSSLIVSTKKLPAFPSTPSLVPFNSCSILCALALKDFDVPIPMAMHCVGNDNEQLPKSAVRSLSVYTKLYEHFIY